MEELRRQIRVAVFALTVIVPMGVLGFMVLEQISFIDAIWLTFITLTTIGYGDVTAVTLGGRIFTILLVLIGLSALASTLQGTFALFFSPTMRDLRQKRHIQKKIQHLKQHYIICGMGELVDKTVSFLLQAAETHQEAEDEQMMRPIEKYIIVMRDSPFAPLRFIYHVVHDGVQAMLHLYYHQQTFLDTIVVVTADPAYAEHLRAAGVLVIEGDPTADETLVAAGIHQSQAIMVMLEDDTRTLMTVLTAHNLNRTIPITAAVLDEELGSKMARVGASTIITPYGIAGQFLNNATLRPAVNDFFNGLLFDFARDDRIIQLELYDNSPWIGRSLTALKLKENYDTGVIAIYLSDGRFVYAPDNDYVLQEDEVLIAVVPDRHAGRLREACRGGFDIPKRLKTWQPITFKLDPPSSNITYSLSEAEEAITHMSGHFIICGSDQVARSSLKTLDPERPFVVISDDNHMTGQLLKRGFKVVHGNPTHEETLIKAGVKRAQAIMVATEGKAVSALTVITCRALNRRLLITATANTDDMVDKLERAGADRVVSPFHVAARFVLLSTTRPEIRYFMDYVLYNYRTGLETTELYMEDTSPWIGKPISALNLDIHYEAGIIGVRMADRVNFIYAPQTDYVIQPNEVLIVVTPMRYSDDLRDAAHGNQHKRPTTLRQTKILQTDQWTRDMIRELIDQKS